MCCTSVRDLIKDTPLIDRERDTEKEREENKAQHPAGFEPMTALSRGMCSTAVLQPLPSSNGTLIPALRWGRIEKVTARHFFR